MRRVDAMRRCSRGIFAIILLRFVGIQLLCLLIVSCRVVSGSGDSESVCVSGLKAQ